MRAIEALLVLTKVRVAFRLVAEPRSTGVLSVFFENMARTLDRVVDALAEEPLRELRPEEEIAVELILDMVRGLGKINKEVMEIMEEPRPQ